MCMLAIAATATTCERRLATYTRAQEPGTTATNVLRSAAVWASLVQVDVTSAGGHDACCGATDFFSKETVR